MEEIDGKVFIQDKGRCIITISTAAQNENRILNDLLSINPDVKSNLTFLVTAEGTALAYGLIFGLSFRRFSMSTGSLLTIWTGGILSPSLGVGGILGTV